MIIKKDIDNLAIFRGSPIFSKIRSTSNLSKPNFKQFLFYAKNIYKKNTDSRFLKNMLECRLAKMHDVKHCITFCNGLWAIIITMKGLMLPGKDEVVMPSMTYRRLADIAAWVDLVPRFCDINPKTLSSSVEVVEECINNKTAILLIAQPIVKICDMDGLENLSIKHKIPILFDSVEAAYASHKNRMVGSFGNAECFSMHASKLLNSFEGGYTTTNDEVLANKLRKMSSGELDKDNEELPRIDVRLNEIHSAMALASLDNLKKQIKQNKKKFYLYKKLLKKIKGIKLIEYDKSEIRGFKNILVELTNDWPFSREKTIKIMHAENMLVRPYYSPPLHMKKTKYKTIGNNLIFSEELSKKFLLLPSGEFLLEKDIFKIVYFLDYISKNSLEINKKL